MIWLTWRQHRGQALVVAAVFAAISTVLVVTGLPMRGDYLHHVAGCLAHAATSRTSACDQAVNRFGDQYQTSAQYIGLWLDFLPAVIGILIGAPLLGRELETGTWQLAWTQAVPRTRWITVKLTVLGAAVTVAGLGFSALYSWWHAPLDHIQGSGPLDASGFDFEGLSFTGYALFAFATGSLAGALIRRSVPAMAATLAAFIVVRAPVELWLRPHYQAPVTTTGDTTARTDLVLDKGLLDPSGQHLSIAAQNAAAAAHIDIDTYLQSHGIRDWYTYQPVGRAWHFQLIEAAIYAGLTATVLTLTVWQVRRRVQ